MKRGLIAACVTLGVLSIPACVCLTYVLHMVLSRQTMELSIRAILDQLSEPRFQKLYLMIQAAAILGVVGICVLGGREKHQVETRRVTGTLRTPVAVGQAQHGSAQWLQKQQYATAFSCAVLDLKSREIQQLLDPPEQALPGGE